MITSIIKGGVLKVVVSPAANASGFGGPFMVRPYASGEMLKARLLKHGVTCWLVNTGWTGGPFGSSRRLTRTG